MHPIVIMSYDKSPAISKAVAALEEAGLGVRVLNTASAKLKDFLGALAGEEDGEEDTDVADKDDTETAAAAAADVVDDTKKPAEEELATEALLDGEIVQIVITEGSELVLHPSDVTVGPKTFYTLNETKFAFWPKNPDAAEVHESVDLNIGEAQYGLTQVRISSEVANPPILKIGREFFNKE